MDLGDLTIDLAYLILYAAGDGLIALSGLLIAASIFDAVISFVQLMRK